MKVIGGATPMEMENTAFQRLNEACTLLTEVNSIVRRIHRNEADRDHIFDVMFVRAVNSLIAPSTVEMSSAPFQAAEAAPLHEAAKAAKRCMEQVIQHLSEADQDQHVLRAHATAMLGLAELMEALGVKK